MSRPKGLAAMDPVRRRVIAALGGRAAHAQGRAHQWTPEEARRWGRRGGRVSQRRRRARLLQQEKRGGA